jgi:predicted MFS family arabinose efflux permease
VRCSPRSSCSRVSGKERAEKLVGSIEERVDRETSAELEEPDKEIEIEQRRTTSIVEVARTLLSRYPRRSVLGFTLMATQAFIYNAVIFTFTIVLTTFFKISDSATPVYLIPFGIANFLGALLLGRLFDNIGRRTMIAATYLISAVGLFLLGLLFNNGTLGLGGFVAVLCATFFFASAAASAGYLSSLFLGYVIGAALMLIAALVAVVWGVDAEQESLEDVAEPLSAEVG